MTSLRRLSYAAFGLACLHLVFGAVVRISGSGMGCGDHWPRCYGRWFPPLDRPDLIIEVSHRYLASILMLSLVALLVAAWRRRHEPGVGGAGGVVRSAALAVVLGLSAALLGAMTVKLGNAPFATLAHWTVAMSLVAAVVATVIRAGGFGGVETRLGGATAKTTRAAVAAAAMALLTVVMGGLTAKYPGAAVACRSFPLCGANPDVVPAAVHVQLTHRVLAVLLVLHLFGLVMALRKRRESPIVRRVAAVALALGVLQLLVAGAMIGMRLPPVLRSLHEAVGVSIWIATFALAYLARVASDGRAVARGELPVAPATPRQPADLADAGVVRASATPPRGSFATALAEPHAPASLQTREPWQTEAPRQDVVLNDAKAEAPRQDVVLNDAKAEAPRQDVVLNDAKDPHVQVLHFVQDDMVQVLPFAALEGRRVAQDDMVQVLPCAQDDGPKPQPEIKPPHPSIEEPHLPRRPEIDEPPTAPGPDIPPPSEVPPPPGGVPPMKMTMTHSVAVIVARGADL